MRWRGGTSVFFPELSMVFKISPQTRLTRYLLVSTYPVIKLLTSNTHRRGCHHPSKAEAGICFMSKTLSAQLHSFIALAVSGSLTIGARPGGNTETGGAGLRFEP